MGNFISKECPNCGHSLGSTALNSGKGTGTCPECKKKITVEVKIASTGINLSLCNLLSGGLCQRM